MLHKPHVEHIGSAKGRAINEFIYLLIWKKISLDIDQWQRVVDCIRQPKKSNEQFDLPVRGSKFELDL
jgi:hypothetical protein